MEYCNLAVVEQLSVVSSLCLGLVSQSLGLSHKKHSQSINIFLNTFFFLINVILKNSYQPQIKTIKNIY